MEAYETLIVCPYDKTHMIEPLRMPYHLIKCRKNHPTMDMAVCPLNANHVVHKVELRYHMQHCPNKALLEREIMQDALRNAALDTSQTALKGYTSLPKYNYKIDDQIIGDEWDREPSDHRFSLFSSNSGSRRAGFSRTSEPATLRHPTTYSKAAQHSGQGEPVPSHNTVPVTQSFNTETDLSGFPKCQDQQSSVLCQRTGERAAASDSMTPSDSATHPSICCPVSIAEARELSMSTPARGSIATPGNSVPLMVGRGRARPAEHSEEPRPGLAARLMALRQGAATSSSLPLTAIARGRSMKLSH